MRHEYRFVMAIIAVLVLAISCPASGSFLDWRPFIVREDLASVKIVRKAMRLPAYAFEKYITDNKELSNNIKVEDERRERKWSEFQFRSFRLRISRYNDLRIKSDTGRSNNAGSVWETIQSLPAQMGGSPYRETLETMGKVFAPQLDLGIEF